MSKSKARPKSNHSPTTVVSTRITAAARKVLAKLSKERKHKNISFTVGEAIQMYISEAVS